MTRPEADSVQGTGAVTVRPAAIGDRDAWNACVESVPGGSFFHYFEWQDVFRTALGHKTHYLVAERNGKTVGVMPLVEMRTLLSGHTLSSTPFATYGGPVGAGAEIREALEHRAVEIARTLQVGALELRYREPSGRDRPVKLLYETFSKPIEPEPDANMKAIRSKQRNVIRKGIKAGLVSEETDLDTFYAIYSESVRNLGTPVFTRRLFREIRRSFPESTEFLGVFHEGKAVSAAMNFYFLNEVCPYYWGGRFEARRLSANDFLAWEIMNRAAGRGCDTFDFGRSKKDTGAHKWKVNLGFEPSQLYYEYELVEDGEMPEVNPNNPKYGLMIDVWKRLPLPVSRLLGPWVSGGLG